MSGNKLTHIAGTFLIQADAAFLNGAGLGEGEDRNVTVPKTFRDGKNEVPYVSAQAWKRWLRNTFIDETKWATSVPKASGWNIKGNVNKISSELNPVEFAEDDIFGYMRAEVGQGRRSEEEEAEESENGVRTKAIMRASPFMASLLVSLRSTGWKGNDEGFVHLKKYDSKSLAEAEIDRFRSAVSSDKDKKKNAWEWLKGSKYGDEFVVKLKTHTDNGELDELRELLSNKAKEEGKEVKFIENPCSPLPYTTRFYNTNLHGVFCLNYSRLGVYWNLGDRIELDESIAKKLLKDGKINDITGEEPYKTLSDNGKIGKIYRVTDAIKPSPKERAVELLKALAILRGGAKQAQFGTDVSPKALIIAGLTCGNPIFNHIFKDTPEGPEFKLDAFKEIITDYSDRIVTPVFIGIRSGYLKNEGQVRELAGKYTVINKENYDGRTIKKVEDSNSNSNIEVKVLTPIETALNMEKYL